MSDKPEYRQYWMDRERGILTESDRQFLKDRKDLTDQGERDARYRIRNRVEEGILDLAYLAIFLDDSDRQQVASKVFPGTAEGNDSIYNSLRFLIQLYFDSRPTDDIENTLDELAELQKDVVASELRLRFDDRMADVDVSIEYDETVPDESELLGKYQNNEESLQEFNYLVENELIEYDREYWRHQFRHAWENHMKFSFASEEKGGIQHDPDDYENQSEFISEGLEIIDHVFDL